MVFSIQICYLDINPVNGRPEYVLMGKQCQCLRRYKMEAQYDDHDWKH